MTRLFFLAWLGLGLVPPAWWLATRRRVDVWRALPVPAAILSSDNQVRAAAGPTREIDFGVSSGLPAPGHVAQAVTDDGTPVALAGLRGGGALALALPADPIRDRRDRILAELGARLAHDINTPLAALQGHLELLTHDVTTEASKESVRTCQRELQRLQTTAQDLLTYTRIKAGGGRREPYLAGALLEEAAAALLDEADARGVDFAVEVPTERVLVDVADGDLVRALRNLMVNALRHGRGDAAIVRAHIEYDDASVGFVVADSGSGLTNKDVAELSQPLVRGRDVKTTGSGLGLAIVAEILRAHGAALESVRTANGMAALLFRLPRALP